MAYSAYLTGVLHSIFNAHILYMTPPLKRECLQYIMGLQYIHTVTANATGTEEFLKEFPSVVNNVIFAPSSPESKCRKDLGEAKATAMEQRARSYSLALWTYRHVETHLQVSHVC